MNFLNKQTPLDDEIHRIEMELSTMKGGTKDYTITCMNLSRLYAMSRENRESKSIKPDTIAQIIGSLVSIIAVMHYEETRVIASKAWGLIRKLTR